MLREAREGLGYVLGNRYLRSIAACTGISNFATSLAFAIFLVYAVRDLDLSPAAIGIVFSISSVGSLAAALTATRVSSRLGVGPTIVASAFVFAPPMILIAAAPPSAPIPFLVVAFVLFGYGAVIYNITQISFRQAICPERLQGRMNSVMRFIVWGVMPIGSLLGGALATWIGLRETMWIGAVIGSFAFLPVLLSPVRTLREMPEPVSTEPAAALACAARGRGVGAGARSACQRIADRAHRARAYRDAEDGRPATESARWTAPRRRAAARKEPPLPDG
jgi:MFS family permease